MSAWSPILFSTITTSILVCDCAGPFVVLCKTGWSGWSGREGVGRMGGRGEEEAVLLGHLPLENDLDSPVS